VDKLRVKVILAPYSPPLSPSQVDAIATEIASLSAEKNNEPGAPKPARKKSHNS
jgi:hypothetical protein